MGGEYDRKRLYASVYKQTTPLRWCGGISDIGPGDSGALDKHPFASCQAGSRSNTFYITDHGGVRSRTLKRLAERLLLWADANLDSIRAFYVPGRLNCGMDMPSREGVVHGEWRLHPQMVQLIWSLFREAVLSQVCHKR